MALRLKKSVSVHDVERHPAGGPLTVIEKGVYARDIPDHMLEQLHVDHFVDDDGDPDPADAKVQSRDNSGVVTEGDED